MFTKLKSQSIFFVLLGVCGFGWFFLMQLQILPAFLCVLVSVIPPVMMIGWVNAPLKTYVREHKTVFMPKLAKALNGLKFYPNRGVSKKILDHLHVLPAYHRYEAEDCFMGTYKGVKVVFSEARLYSRADPTGPIFDGIFVLLEIPGDPIEGHTILTSDLKMVKEYAKTRWKNLHKTHVSVSNPDWDIFEIYSTAPESAELMIGDKLLKELTEAAAIFKTNLTAVLFANKYVFMMIPCEEDMFEPSNIHVPVTTKQHALQCKKEIEQLLEIIDVFDVYKPIQS